MLAPFFAVLFSTASYIYRTYIVDASSLVAASADALCVGTSFSYVVSTDGTGLPVLQIGTELETSQRMR